MVKHSLPEPERTPLLRAWRVLAVGLGLLPPRLQRTEALRLLTLSAPAIGLVAVSHAVWRGFGDDGFSAPIRSALVLFALIHARAVAVALWRIFESSRGSSRRIALASPQREPLLKIGWVLIAALEITLLLGELPWNFLSLAPLTQGRVPWLPLWGLGLGLVYWLVLLRSLRDYEATRSPHERWRGFGDEAILHGQILANAAAEELLFRYAQIEALSIALGGGRTADWIAIVVSATLFGLAHAYRGQPSGLRGAIIMLVLGLVLGFLAVWLETIWVGFLIHAFVLGGHGAKEWLTRWAGVRRSLSFVPFFAYSRSEHWYLINIEGSRAWPLCRCDSRLGRFLNIAREQHSGFVLALPWSEAEALFIGASTKGGSEWEQAPSGLQLWRRSQGTLFADADRTADTFPSAGTREGTARNAVDLKAKPRHDVRAKFPSIARLGTQGSPP